MGIGCMARLYEGQEYSAERAKKYLGRLTPVRPHRCRW
jgi:hypothetical protein